MNFQLLVYITSTIIFAFVAVRPVGAADVKAASESVVAKEATQGAFMEATDEAPMQKQDYQLPYHGLLPDNPLYALKSLRDNIINLLISDPLKKADFALLQGEKHTSMVIALVEKGKADVAQQTANKGNTYLDRAVTLYKKAKGDGRDVSSLSDKFVNSLAKQEDVFLGLASKTEGDHKDQFQKLAEKVMQYRKSL